MENASKALIIAGEVFIAIMVLTLLVYVFSAFGSFSANMHKEMAESQKTEFNSNFTIYENRVNITATEIVTAINFAKQANNSRELKRNETSSEYYVRVYIDGIDVFNSSRYIGNDNDYNNRLKEIMNNFIKENNTVYFGCNAILEKKANNVVVNLEKYKNDVVVNENTGLVSAIYFHTIDPNLSNVLNS